MNDAENKIQGKQVAEVTVGSVKGVRPAQLAMAWVLAKGKMIVPVIGARTRAQLAESLGALQVTRSSADIARVEEAIPASAIAG